MFDQFADHEFLPLAGASAISRDVKQRFADGQPILTAGQLVEDQMMIIDGVVLLTRPNADGTETMVDFLEAGDFIEPGAHGRHSLNARACGPVSVQRHKLQGGKLPLGMKFRILQNANRQIARRCHPGQAGTC